MRAHPTHRYVPALRGMLSDRGVYLTVVDLRWGVTVEQATSGEVVRICLSELRKSQYIVSFLGHRVGFRPSVADLSKGMCTCSYRGCASPVLAAIFSATLEWRAPSRAYPPPTLATPANPHKPAAAPQSTPHPHCAQPRLMTLPSSSLTSRATRSPRWKSFMAPSGGRKDAALPVAQPSSTRAHGTS